jgi:hypothetical protein
VRGVKNLLFFKNEVSQREGMRIIVKKDTIRKVAKQAPFDIPPCRRRKNNGLTFIFILFWLGKE